MSVLDCGSLFVGNVSRPLSSGFRTCQGSRICVVAIGSWIIDFGVPCMDRFTTSIMGCCVSDRADGIYLSDRSLAPQFSAPSTGAKSVDVLRRWRVSGYCC